jgi:hypothetical protein
VVAWAERGSGDSTMGVVSEGKGCQGDLLDMAVIQADLGPKYTAESHSNKFRVSVKPQEREEVSNKGTDNALWPGWYKWGALEGHPAHHWDRQIRKG